LRGIADAKGVSVAQVAIGWVLSRGEDIVPVIGARKRERLAEALSALDVAFSADELKRIEAAVPLGAAAGDRYDKWGMSMLDSEKSTGEKSSTRGNAA
jgi:aryl-alcohol dehydrogenase-like predicted oxidoreductase